MSRIFQCLVVLATASFATATYADHIIDEHIKAMGGTDNIAKVKSIERSGNVSLTGPFGAFQGSMETTLDVEGKRGHQVMDLAIFRIESAWTGDEGWQDGPPNGLRDMTEEEISRTKMNGSACIAASIKEEYGMAAFNEPTDEKFNEKDCAKVTVKESPLELYINKETKLLEGIGIKDTLTVTMEDYKAIDGVQFPGKATTRVAQPEITIVNEFEETKLNGELDDAIFAKPEPAEEPATP